MKIRGEPEFSKQQFITHEQAKMPVHESFFAARSSQLLIYSGLFILVSETIQVSFFPFFPQTTTFPNF
jgi:hypothetical protein